MGMFDYVKFELPCPTCGTTITDFQTKDGECMLGRLAWQEVRAFYALCQCGTWIEFTRKPASSIEEFTMVVETKP